MQRPLTSRLFYAIRRNGYPSLQARTLAVHSCPTMGCAGPVQAMAPSRPGHAAAPLKLDPSHPKLVGVAQVLVISPSLLATRTRTAVTPEAVTPEESNRGHRIAAPRLGGSLDRVLEGIHETMGIHPCPAASTRRTHWKSSTRLKPSLVHRPSHELDATGLTGFPPSASLLLSAETNITPSDKSY
jgi:hypothetical protein